MSKTYIPKALRERVAAQGRYRCGYCLTQERVVGVPMDVEHIIPEVLGGLNAGSVEADADSDEGDDLDLDAEAVDGDDEIEATDAE